MPMVEKHIRIICIASELPLIEGRPTRLAMFADVGELKKYICI